jgi:hypothetical protein
MLRACMLDGFGWFHEADYRRLWLFFDSVDYILPKHLRGKTGDLFYLPAVEQAREYSATRPELTAEAIALLEEGVEEDLGDSELAALLKEVPPDEADYARKVVTSDRAFGSLTNVSPQLAVVLLLNKLLLYARASGRVPIVGRPYARRMLRNKIARGARRFHGPVAPRIGVTSAEFAAGLSLDFIPDHALAQASFERLEAFKEKCQPLLEEHQAALLEVASSYEKIPDDAGFEHALEKLRLRAAFQRRDLDLAASAVWTDLGYETVKAAVEGASKHYPLALTAVLALAHTGLIAALPTAIAALGVAAAKLIEVAKKHHDAEGKSEIAYLLRAHRELA